MAYVKMSNAVIDRVMSAANRMRDNELRELMPPSLALTDDALFEHVRRLAWGENQHLMPPAIPEEWCVSAGRVEFRGEDDDAGYATVAVTGATSRWFPPGFTNSSYYPFTVPGTVEEVYGPAAPLIRQTLDLARQRAEVVDKWARIRQQLEDYMESMPSLNKAVEGMPGLALYLDTEHKDRLAAPAVKRSANKAVAEDPLARIDAEAIISAAMANRIAYGAVK